MSSLELEVSINELVFRRITTGKVACDVVLNLARKRRSNKKRVKLYQKRVYSFYLNVKI